MKKYAYAGGEPLFTQVGGVAAIIFGTLMAGVFVAGPILLNRDTSLAVNLTCFAIWFLMVGWMVGLTMINAYPTIWVGDQHLVISAFFLARVHVPWTEVVDVRRVRFGNILVRARRITLFHRWYGWLYSRSLYPGFLVGRGIQDHDVLLREIERRIRGAF